jgi:hypothetical protein
MGITTDGGIGDFVNLPRAEPMRRDAPDDRTSPEAGRNRPPAGGVLPLPEGGSAGLPSGPPGGEGSSSPAPESVPVRGGPKPIWRSLLAPQAGQRALALSPQSLDLFGALSEEGVDVEWDVAAIRGRQEAAFDLVLDERSPGTPCWRPGRIRPFLAPGGRWVTVVRGRPIVGWSARVVMLRARRERFETVETFYAHPSLQAPQMLVPLDRSGPFHYFLGLAVGVRTLRQRFLTHGLRALCALGLHREVLPNLIVVARRKR